MSATRKPRGDAKLKTLPEARQEQIAEMLAAKTLQDVKRELAQDGLQTSANALSEFWSWWQLRQQFAEKESLVEELMASFKEANPDISEEKLFEHGQTVFALLALKDGSAKDWKRVQDVRHRRQIISLERQKFQRETAEMFIKWHKDQRAIEIVNNRGLSPSQQIELLGQIMFEEDWQLPAGGTAK